MKAENRNLTDWFNEIESGRLRLPRFQRFEEWDQNRIADVVQTVLRGLPIGALLILNVGDKEKFISRPLVGAPKPRERCIEHLLDGQQRLTALWRALHDNYDDRTYLFKFIAKGDPEAEGLEDLSGETVAVVHGIRRYENRGTRYPIWVDDPAQVWERNYIPVRLLRPGESAITDTKNWARAVFGGQNIHSDELETKITSIRQGILGYNIPYLALPSSTPKSVALDVFIKINTSMVQLGDFDILVAQFEAAIGESLHQFIDELVAAVPNIRDYVWVENYVLNVACLRNDRSPTRANFFRLDLNKLADDWENLVAGIKWAIDVMREECIWDDARLPSVAPIQVIPALHSHLPKSGDALGNATRLIRKYIWRSFFTRRYDQAASTYALQDMRALIRVLDGTATESDVPVFSSEYTLPTVEEIRDIGWPSKRDTLARAMLAVTIKRGALDIADGAQATAQHVRHREYHHLFPDSLLTGDGMLSSSDSYRALNCALITWNTNRTIAAKEPLQYLKDRAERSALGEKQIRSRLRSHIVPFDSLAVGGYTKVTDLKKRAERIQSDYNAFLNARAREFMEPIQMLCEGRNWPNEAD